MRSQLVLAFILTLAITGCGKSVTREAGLVAQTASPENTLRSSIEPCVDPIGEPQYKVVQNFSDLAQESGNYELASIQAVSHTTVSGFTGNVEGISVISGVSTNGKMKLTQVCSDYSQVPVGTHSWKISAPVAVEATRGTVSKEMSIQQSVSASNNVQYLGTALASIKGASGCLNINEVISGKKCEVAQVYQIDSTTIGVLRKITTKNSTSGSVVSKIFAQYILTGVKEKKKTEPKASVKKSPCVY